jgi:hypothetical protein
MQRFLASWGRRIRKHQLASPYIPYMRQVDAFDEWPRHSNFHPTGSDERDCLDGILTGGSQRTLSASIALDPLSQTPSSGWYFLKYTMPYMVYL